MADKLPVKAYFAGSDVTALGEFQTGDTIPVANGGTGVTTTGALKTALALDNVDNTSDANKPVSTAQASALALKAPLASPAFTGTPTGITKAHVGLANVDNTSDANKPVSTAQATALGLKYDKTGGTLSGNATINSVNPTLVLAKTASGQSATLLGQTGSLARWQLTLGTSEAEVGANVGSNFYVSRFSDAGAYLGDPMVINRASGNVSFANALSATQITSTGSVVANSGFFIPPLATGITGTALANEGGTYRFRIWSGTTAIGSDTQAYAEHNPGNFLRNRFTIAGVVFDMDSGGTGVSPGGWVPVSDRRVKYDPQVITGALDKIEQLTGYTYLRQDMFDINGVIPRRAGLLAQDVLRVLPETIMVPANYDAEKDQGDLLKLYLDGVIGLLVNAVKELRAEVAELRANQK